MLFHLKGLSRMASFSNLPFELRVHVWQLSLPNDRVVELGISLDPGMTDQGAVNGIIYLPDRQEYLTSDLYQVNRLSGVCVETRLVVLMRYPNILWTYRREEGSSLPLPLWPVRCSFANDVFAIGEIVRGRWAQSSAGTGTTLLEQLKCVRNIMIDQLHSQMDIVGMVSADGANLGPLTLDLTRLVHAATSLRVLHIGPGCVSLLALPQTVQQQDPHEQRRSMEKLIRRVLGLQIEVRVRLA